MVLLRLGLAATITLASAVAPSLATLQPGAALSPLSALYIDASVVQNGPFNAAIRDIQRDWYKVRRTKLGEGVEVRGPSHPAPGLGR